MKMRWAWRAKHTDGLNMLVGGRKLSQNESEKNEKSASEDVAAWDVAEPFTFNDKKRESCCFGGKKIEMRCAQIKAGHLTTRRKRLNRTAVVQFKSIHVKQWRAKFPFELGFLFSLDQKVFIYPYLACSQGFGSCTTANNCLTSPSWLMESSSVATDLSWPLRVIISEQCSPLTWQKNNKRLFYFRLALQRCFIVGIDLSARLTEFFFFFCRFRW